MTATSYSDHLASIRAHYVETLAHAIAGTDGHVEPVYRTDDGEAATDGALGLPCRADFIQIGDGDGDEPEAMTIDAGFAPGFETEYFTLADTEFELDPFGWDWMTLSIFGLSDEEASDVLSEWFWDWFDPNDENEPTPEGLFGVVHFMSDPEVIDNGIKLNVDLGSAPVDALEALLSSLADASASEVHIG